MSSTEHVERASPPHFQISPEEVRGDSDDKKLFIHSLFPRHAQPSLLPVKEAVSVLSLHEASQPSNTLIDGLRVDRPRQLTTYAWV